MTFQKGVLCNYYSGFLSIAFIAGHFWGVVLLVGLGGQRGGVVFLVFIFFLFFWVVDYYF